MDIRDDQLQAFQQDAWRRFEEEMVEHSRALLPKRCQAVGDPQLRLAVRSSLQRASHYGFTKRGSIRLFVELGLLCGSSFDTDPQFAALSAPLRGAEDEMLRAQQMHEEHTRFIEQVPELSGPAALTALKQLAAADESPDAVPSAGFDAELALKLKQAFPERTQYVGENGLAAFLQEARQMAAHYGLSTRRQVRTMLLLMLGFGHGCAVDPMCPWIMRILQDETMETMAARTDLLERRMLVWLEHIVAEPSARPDA